jgi:single-strand DNA-binding protein
MTVATINVATNRTWRDKDGKQQEEVEYHTIVVYGKTAENVGKYVSKGQIVMATGRVKTRSWEKDGVKQYRTEIIADNLQFGPNITSTYGNKQQASAPASPSAMPDYPEMEINSEDVPF